MDITDSNGGSYSWASIINALQILKYGCRVRQAKEMFRYFMTPSWMKGQFAT